MDLLGQVDELRAVLEDAARGTGRLAAGFRPGNAAAGQLRAVVLTAIERFHAECGSGCLVTVDEPAATIPLEQAQATALNTLLLLALAGVARHQRAARALVHARVEACRIVVEIRGPAQTGVRETVPSRSDRRSRASRRIEFDELDAWLRALGGALRFGDGDESFVLRLELPLAPP
jgi:hypothetical protein